MFFFVCLLDLLFAPFVWYIVSVFVVVFFFLALSYFSFHLNASEEATNIEGSKHTNTTFHLSTSMQQPNQTHTRAQKKHKKRKMCHLRNYSLRKKTKTGTHTQLHACLFQWTWFSTPIWVSYRRTSFITTVGNLPQKRMKNRATTKLFALSSFRFFGSMFFLRYIFSYSTRSNNNNNKNNPKQLV